MEIFIMIITFFSAILFLRYSRIAKQKNVNKNIIGLIVLKQSSKVINLGYITIFMALLFTIVAIIEYIPGDINNIYPLVAISTLYLSGITLVLGYHYEKGIFSRDKIITYSLLGKKKEILWENIKEISFNSTTMKIRFKSEFITVNISTHLIGFSQLIEEMKHRVDKKIYEDSLRQLKILNLKNV